jgi:hypothetical protein
MVTAALMLAVLLTACGSEDPSPSESAGATATRKTDPFRVEAAEGGQRVVGHGLVLEVPAGWKEDAPEKPSTDGESAEWALLAPPGPGPFPPYVNVSAGVKQRPKVRFDDAMAVFKGVQSLNPAHRMLEEGAVEIPGARRAHRFHFTYEREVTDPRTGKRVPTVIEQVQIFVDMPGGQVTAVRFFAPKPEFAAAGFDRIQSSLRVAETVDKEGGA